jgi:26S proteasome regulatory subunit RPN2 C-terminal domain
VTVCVQLPKFEFVSNARPSLFAYQPATKPPQKETVEKVATAVLSTTAKATARQKTKEKEKAAAEAMDTVCLDVQSGWWMVLSDGLRVSILGRTRGPSRLNPRQRVKRMRR